MTTYTTYKSQIKGNTFSILVASGKFNYVSVSKLTNNPFYSGGKDFETFDAATKAYKSTEMKSFILQVELGLLQPTSQLVHA
jgi:hypothetical protein